MTEHKAKAGAAFSAGLRANGGAMIGGPSMLTRYHVECWRDGRLQWVENVENLVVNQGLNDLLDKYFKGSTYTAAFYVGLIDNASFGSVQAGDTAAKITETVNAPTTNDWQEATEYDEATREALVLGSVSSQSVDNSASKAEFTISATVTINGAFLVTSNTKGGTSGVLYGGASFASPRAVVDNDTLLVTVTLTAAAA